MVVQWCYLHWENLLRLMVLLCYTALSGVTREVMQVQVEKA